MGCGASSNHTEEILEELRLAVVTGAGVAAYIVTGAGQQRANGVYVRDGRYEDAPCFRNAVSGCTLWREDDTWYVGGKAVDESGQEAYDQYYSVSSFQDLPPNFGWSTEAGGLEPIPHIQEVEEGPGAYVVEGAGTTQANGTYIRQGTYDGAPMYVNGALCITRTRGNSYKWMIGAKDQLDEEEGDMYISQTSSEYPPTSSSSWELEMDGAHPPPRTRALNALGQPIMAGWLLSEVHPAVMAVATYAAEAVPVAHATALPVK